ncbi:interferon gamma [Apodemus sylvaticus]|uniref:interferon gamma n=1 Tax=Apodemus sylvaticus TaxID=10129 RepID=UPI0022440252|nr:interferon gamma [Apodemus sylvaticus]
MKATHCLLALQLCLMAISGCYCHGTLIESLESLKNYFNSTGIEDVEEKSLLLDIWRNWQKDGDTKILEGQIISFYLRLFEVLKDNQAISNNISVIESHLITNFFSNSKAKKDAFMSITKFEVNNPQIQRRAARELIRLIHQLSPESSLRKRKRSRC